MSRILMFMHFTLPIDYLLACLMEISGNYMYRPSRTLEDREISWAKRTWLISELLVVQKYIL
jgi:hypothetical protein